MLVDAKFVSVFENEFETRTSCYFDVNKREVYDVMRNTGVVKEYVELPNGDIHTRFEFVYDKLDPNKEEDDIDDTDDDE